MGAMSLSLGKLCNLSELQCGRCPYPSPSTLCREDQTVLEVMPPSDWQVDVFNSVTTGYDGCYPPVTMIVLLLCMMWGTHAHASVCQRTVVW